MKKLSPDSSPSSRRVFVACLLSFAILITPIAAIAAPRSVGSPTVTDRKLSKTNAKSNSSARAAVVNRPLAPPQPVVPTITATKVDSLENDDGDGKIDPTNGDAGTTERIKYTVTIGNSITEAATGVAFADTIDPHTTLIGGSLNVSPLAGDDTYATIGNTLLEVGPVAAPSSLPKVTVTGSVLDNDTDFLGAPAPTLKTPFPTTSTNAGTVTMESNGRFSYTPAADFSGADTFTYTITDAGADLIAGNADDLTNTGTVTINVNAQKVWYVKNDAAGGGTGTSTSPFNTLLAAQAASDVGETIFVFFGNGTTSGQSSGITLKANQRFIGEGVQLDVPVSVNGGPNPTVLRAAGSAPLVTNTAGNSVTVTSIAGVSIRGFSFVNGGAGNTNAIAVSFTAAGGGVTISNNSIAGGTGNAIDVTTSGASAGGSVTITNNAITGAGAEGIDINANGTGTLIADVNTNTLNATGNAFDLSENAGAVNLNFSTNTGITSADGAGSAVNIVRVTGTLTITGFANNTVSGNSAGTGINVVNGIFDVTPGGSFQQVSGGTTVIGAVGNGVGDSGLILSGMTGDLAFTDLDIVNDGGTGLSVAGAGQLNAGAGTGTGISVGAGVGTIASVGGPAVNVSSATANLQLASITSANSATQGVVLTSVNGTFSAGSGSTLTNAATADFDISGGTATVTYNGTITDDVGTLVSISGATGGTKSFTGAITDNNDGDGGELGISLTSNTGATISFSGGLAIRTTASAAFTATGGGTVTATQNNTSIVNTLTTTSGTALNVANTTIGAGGLTFRSISSNGAANGVLLNTTGASGSLVVTGNAGSCTSTGTCTGGAIQNSTNHAISLTSTLSPSFTRIAIQNAARSGIDGQQVTNFTLANSFIDNVGTGAAGQYDESNLSFNDNGAFTTTALSGTVSITSNTLTNARRHGIQIENGTGTISNLTITGNTLTSSTSSAVSLGTGILALIQGSAASTAHLTTGTISGNTVTNFPSGEGIAILGGSGNSANNTSATLGANGTPINITNNTISGQAAAGQHMGSNAIRGSMNSNVGVMNFNISCNGKTTGACTATGPITNIEGQGISVFAGGSITGTTTIDNNILIPNQTLLAGTQGLAVQVDDGPAGLGTSAADYNVVITNNSVTNYEGSGIRAIARASLGKMDVTIQNNTVGTPIMTNRHGIRVDSGSAAGDVTLCMLMTGNTSDGSGINAGIGIRKQGNVATTNDFGITGLVPSPATAATAAAKVAADNPAGGGVDVLSGDNFVSCVTSAMYKPERPNRQYEVARGSETVPQSGSDSLFSRIGSKNDFVSMFATVSGSAWYAPPLTSNNAKPVRATAVVTGETISSREPASPTMLSRAASSVSRLVSAVDSLIVPTASAARSEQRSEVRSQRSDVRMNHAKSRKTVVNDQRSEVRGNVSVASNALAPMPSGETVNAAIGTLPAGKSITIEFKVTLDNPPNLTLLNPPRVRNQGTVSGTNFTLVNGTAATPNTDDTDAGGATDPTDTPVDLFDTSTTLVSDLNPSNFGDQVTFTATVSETPAIGSVDPTGTVDFIDTSNGNAVICDDVALTGGQAQCQTSSLSASTHNIRADYSGDGNFDSSQSNVVAQVVNPCLTNPIVTSTADSGANTLREAITTVCSAPNNNVTFNLGAGPNTITILSTLVIDRNVNITNTLSGTNGALTVSAGGGNFRAFSVDSPVTAANLSGFTVTGVSATGTSGGGLFAQNGTTTLTDMLFTGNTVINGGGGGLGVSSGATLNVRNSTISGNTATFGGGIYNNASTLNLLNVTITNNTADGNVGGGPIGGAGAIGGGIETGSGLATNVRNSIVTGNFATTGANISGTITDQGNNILTGDPLIGLLADNGGLTRTHALLPTSPAVDAGDNTAASAIPLTTDQRGAGFPRIADSADLDTTATVDIGAFELHPSIEDIPDKNTPEDTLLSFSFNIGDGTGALIASVTAVSSNTTLVPNDVAHLTVTGAGSSRTLNITPAANANTAADGTATITVTVTATNGQTAQDTFVLTVDAVNDAPSFVEGADQTVDEDAGAQTVNGWATSISKGPADEAGQTLTFNISPTGSTGSLTFSSGPAIDPTTGNLTYTPTADTNGTANFSVTLSDNGSNTPPSSNTSGAQTFTITVNSINDPPSFTEGPDQSVGEDAGAQTVNGWATNISPGPNETGQILTFTVSPTGSTGSLTFSTAPAIDATTGTLTYTPTNGTNGTATFDVTLSDNGSNVPPNSNTSAAQSFTITVDSVNDPPVNTVPGAQSIPRNTVFTFSGANVISVADPDAAQAPSDGIITVTLTATNGAITLSGTAGLDFSCGSCAGDGVADTTMTFQGTIPAINAALNGATFTPTLNFTGAASVQIVSDDQGKTGTGGAKTDTDTVNFTVNAVLDIYLNEINFNPPGTDAPNEYIELRGPASTVIPPGTYFVAIEGDAADNAGDVQTIINLSGLSFGSNGFLVILQQGNTYTTAAGATVIAGSTTGFGGLPGNIFQADAAATDIEDASVSFMLIQTGVAPALTDDIDADNNGTTDGSVFPGWSVRDSINAMGTSANARAYGAFGYRNTAGSGTSLGAEVSVPFIPSYVGRIGDSTGSTAADWVASGVLGGAAPNWTLGVAAETEPASFAGKPLNHIGASNFVNLPPVNTVPGAQATNEDTPLVFTGATQISISDPDAGGAVVKVTLTAVNGTFSLSGIGGLNFTTGDGTNDTQMVFTGTIADINTALNNLTFTPPSNFFSPPVASLTILTEDQGNTGVGGNQTDSDTINITVNAVNDPPSFNIAGNPPAVNEDAGAQTVNGFATGMSQGPGETGQTLTFNVSPVSSTGNLAFSSGPAIDTTTGNLTYTSSADTNGTATFSVTLSDNGGGTNTSAPQQFTITVNAVNDAPTFQIPSNPPAVNEDAGAQAVAGFATNFQPGPVTATDEIGQTLVGYTVTANGTTGNLAFTSGPSINNAGQLTYTPTANTSGTATFDVVATDSGSGTAPNVNQSAVVSFTITVNGQNDAPVLDNTGNMSLTAINEDVPAASNPGTLVSDIILSAGGDRITDVDAGALEGIAVIAVDNTNGTWQFSIDNGTNWTAFGSPNATTARLLAADALTRVRFLPNLNFNGTIDPGITFRAWDQTSGTNGSTADPSVNNGGTFAFSTATETASITVNAVNDNPTTIGIPPVNVNEDAADTVIDLRLFYNDVEDGPAGLVYTVQGNTNPGLFTAISINNANDNLTLDYAANANGSAQLTIRGTDTGGLFVETTLNVTVSAVNDPPSFTKGANQTVNEDAGAQTVAGWATSISQGPGESGQTLTFNVSINGTTGNLAFSSAPAINATTGTLTYTTSANTNGTATIDVTLSDNGSNVPPNSNTSAVQQFTIAVNAVNDAPTFQIASNPPAVNEDAGAQTVNSFATNFQPGPAAATDEAGQTLVGYTVTPTGTTGSLAFTSGPSINNAGQLTYTPTGNTSGTATFNVVATDSGSGTAPNVNQSAAVAFTITVNAVNDAPVLDNTGNMSLTAINEDVPNAANAGTLVSDIIASAGGDRITDVDAGAVEGIAVTAVDNTNGTWQFSIDNGANWTAFGSPNATTARLLAANANTRVRFAPNLNFNGTIDPGITFRAWDQTSGVNGNTADASVNGNTTAFSTATETASITVNPVNDNPTTTGVPAVNVNEDAANTVLDLRLSFGDVEDGAAGLVYIVQANSNPGLFTSTLINNANDNLTLDYAPNANGVALITIRGTDTGGLFVDSTFMVTVNAVNDVPSFTKGPDLTVQDPNPQSFPNWATNISAGPPDESGQTLTFLVTNDNNVLFSAQPAISPNGTLTFTAAAGQDGVATVTVRLMDNGGTANGGVDTSAPQTFVLTVHALNNAPTLDAIPALSINEDAPLQTVNLSGITPGPSFESNQILTVTATSDNPALIPNPNVSYTNPNTTGSLSFTPVPNANGSATITVTVKDNGGTANGGVDTFVRTFLVIVHAVNDAPVNSVPGPQNAPLNGDLIFSAANSNLISITDDSGSNPIRVTLQATDGTLTLSTTIGLAFNAGDGTDDPLMTFTGSLANINAALNGMKNLAFGSGVITITTNDLGHSGSGGPLSDTDTIAVTVVDNLAPQILTIPGTDRAIAFESINFVIDPFNLQGNTNFLADHRTHIMLFALHAQLRPGETFTAVTAEAEVAGTVVPLIVESVNTVPGFDWLTQIVVKFPDGFSTGGGGPHDAKITIRLRGQSSNQAVIIVVPAPKP